MDGFSRRRGRATPRSRCSGVPPTRLRVRAELRVLSCRRFVAGRTRAARPDRDPHGRGPRARRRFLRARAQPRGQAAGARAGAATLLSQATTEIVHDHLPPGTELIDLGSKELRGLSRARAGLRAAHNGGRDRCDLTAGARDPQDDHGPLCLRDRVFAAGGGSRRRGAPPGQLALPRRHAGGVRATRRDGRGIPGRRAHGRVRRAGASRRRCPACGARGRGARGGAAGARGRTGRGLRRAARHPCRAWARAR